MKLNISLFFIFIIAVGLAHPQIAFDKAVNLPDIGKKNGNQDKSVVGRYQQPRKGPVIVFKRTVYDFGNIYPDKDVSCSFVYYNKGDGPLILKNVEASCGCTIPTWSKKPLMPGDSAVINAVFHPQEYEGQAVNKSITVQTYIKENGQDKNIYLFLKGSVRNK